MTSLRDLVQEARATSDYRALIEAIPYARFLGFSFEPREGELLGRMAFAQHVVGNARVGALHGGALGALMELTGAFAVLHEAEALTVPKTINITVEYLRQAHFEDTYCRAELVRKGRRVVNVRLTAWQSDEKKPVTAAVAHYLIDPGETTAG
ncbi:MAG: PaaI family thioesterase [Myxococcales bacterium]|nr:PaaI family thioesterase [Myxococcales bacterium]